MYMFLHKLVRIMQFKKEELVRLRGYISRQCLLTAH